MTAFVALFRGINVGGHHKVPMSDLKELHEALGFRDVASYIQSGNIVFTSDEIDPGWLEKRIEEGFTTRFGFPTHVLVRSSAELDATIAHSPFQGQADRETKWIVVQFLANDPDDAGLEEFRQGYAGPEELFLRGKELYVYYPNSIGHSKLPQGVLEKKLKTTSTARNWNTVLKLQEMMRG